MIFRNLETDKLIVRIINNTLHCLIANFIILSFYQINLQEKQGIEPV